MHELTWVRRSVTLCCIYLSVLKPRLTKFRKSGIAVYTTTVISGSIAKRYLRQVGISIANNSRGEQMQKES